MAFKVKTWLEKMKTDEFKGKEKAVQQLNVAARGQGARPPPQQTQK